MSTYESEDDDSEETYQLCERDRQIVAVTRHLLWEIVRWNQIQANQLEVVAKVLQVLERLPVVSDELFASVLLKGPQRYFGDHQIFHWWNVEVEGHDLAVSSGGYFHRPSTGGDSFMCMTWSAAPDYETDYSDFLHTLQLVDDAQSFDAEVMQLALGEPGYSLEISVDGEAISGFNEDEDDDDDDDENNEVDDSVTSDDATTVEPCDDSEQVLSKQAEGSTPMAKNERNPGELFTNNVGMTFAWVPPGSFLMGYTKERPEYLDGPSHKVTLSQGYYLGIHPVTQRIWRTVMGNNPSHFKGDRLPVEQVSWGECQTFLARLSESDGAMYRLPTEAEWEFGCRAGSTTPYTFGHTITREQANFYGKGTSVVGSYPPNSWGIYDMHGNIWEWCADWRGDYQEGEVVDPQGPQSGQGRVLRGGSYHDVPSNVSSDVRLDYSPSFRTSEHGFRVART